MFKFLLKSLYNTDPQYFGLDISNESYKFIQLQRSSKSNFLIPVFGFGKIPKGIIEKGEIKHEDELAKVLKSGLSNPEKGKLTTNYVSFSLPEEHSFIRVLQLPKLSEQETKEAIKWEIEQNIPLNIDEVYFDWQIVLNDKRINHQDILIAAIPKSVADPYISALKKAELFCVAMEPESISIVRSIVKDFCSEEPLLIVDIGATTTSFIIFLGKTIRFSSAYPLGGNKMVQAISKNLDVDPKEAKRLFYDVGFDKNLDKEEKVKKALEELFDELIEQIKNYIDFYVTHPKHNHFSEEKSIKKIVLSGGVANLYGISAYLSSKLKIPVVASNPWINVLKEPLNEIPDLPYRKSLGYTTAIGLALKKV